ncbi:hypothetical protein [Chitinophaga tropicalis]|uniref:DUF3606 domain-containing protein n=1 Tax=Chitinophaga tropicalis TaxID=2683588 RepID=A0A7K1U0X4_9BACT|nr:hypothetical protein [Chitinophaga tropicalis]MVT07936.1 hypothetical protein [Chitinophaga tropicalis]
MNNYPGNNSERKSEHHDTFSVEEIAVRLGVTSMEVQNAIENVGTDQDKIEEFIKRNHTELDNPEV